MTHPVERGFRTVPLGLLLAGFLAGLCACASAPPVSDADLSDPGIQANILAQLRAQKDLDLNTINIDVHSRIVTVSGLVPSYQSRRLIDKIVRETRGVDQTIINLVVDE